MDSYSLNNFSCRYDRTSKMAASWLTAISGLFLLSLLITDAFHFLYGHAPKNQASKAVKLHMAGIPQDKAYHAKTAPQEIGNEISKPVPDKAAVTKHASIQKTKMPKPANAKTNEQLLPRPFNRQKPETRTAKPSENAENVSDALPGNNWAESSMPGSMETETIQNAARSEFSASGLADALASMIDKEKYYPLPAVRAGLEGVVTFLVKVDQNGKIINYTVIKADAGKILVDAAEKTMEKIKASGIPYQLAGRTAEVEVPVVFRID